MSGALTKVGDAPAGPRPALSGLAWVTGRQHRSALVGVGVVLAVSALALVWYGLHEHADFAKLGLAACTPGHEVVHCGALVDAFGADQNRITQLIAVLLPLPVLFGLFIGAPLLAREYESGTFRFAFTQGAGRTRWLMVKIAILTGFTVATSTALTLVVIWWYGPMVALDGRLGGSAVYEVYGAVFVARALFALALGVLAGALLRRVVPAIGATLAVWIAVVIGSVTTLRSHLMAPVRAVNAPAPAHAWTLRETWTAPNGQLVGRAQINELLYQTSLAGHKLDATSYLAQRGYRYSVVYQPGGRFWAFQAIEAGGLVVLSALLLVAAVWLVRRRAA
jgi:hypothetical protein